MAQITHNDILWLSISKQFEWSREQDWTGYTKEQKERVENEKGLEIWRELKAKYNLR